MSELVGRVYDAALENGLWAGLSHRIAQAFDATSAVIKLDAGQAGIQLLDMTPNMVVADGLRDWAEHWHAHDLWVRRSTCFGLSRIVTSDDLVKPDERRCSGFYQEWLRQLEIHQMIGAVFQAGSGAIGVLGVHRPRDGDQFSEADRRAVGVLLPHLERAMRMGQHLAEAGFAQAAALESLDALDTGVVIADGRGRVRHANRVAAAMFCGEGGLSIRSGRLVAVAPALHARLMSCLRDVVALAAGDALPAPALLRIERRARPACSLAIVPLRPRPIGLAWPEPLALVLLRDPEYPPHRIEHLRALFGLTRMEALTAAELARGRTLEDICGALGIGLGTVRTHLRQILAKTQTNRQAEAVATITRSVAAMPSA